MTEVWTQWEGKVVNGIYPLRRFLNASDHSAVFLTESTTEGFLNAAIKLVPADPAQIAVQLWHWKTAATFSHPHLIRLLDSGQCEIEGRPFLFVVMEYAEETLSQTLPYRSLGTDEIRELLVPTLDALAFLHRENWVHGQVKPSNFLVVDDHLKLAADTIRPIGVSAGNVPRLSMYDPPEAERGEVSAASDVWGLGVTLSESLTQYPPTWLHGRSEPPSLPENLPVDFAATVQLCLSVNPADRPTVATLQAQTRPNGNGASGRPLLQASPARAGRPAPPAAADRPVPADPVMRASADGFSTPGDPSEFGEPPRRSLLKPAIAAVTVVLVLVWGGSWVLHRPVAPDTQAPTTKSSDSARATAPPESQSPPPAAAQPPAPRLAQESSPALSAPAPPVTHGPSPVPPAPAKLSSSVGDSNSVVHEEIPRVSPSARATIRGRVKVSVRVTVDSSGKVIRDTLQDAGPSRYFSRLASEASRKWTFTRAENEPSRDWLLRFEFGRDGTTVHATR